MLHALGLVLAAMGVGDPQSELEQKVGERIAPWDRADSPGGAIAILRDGEPLLVRCFGAADVASARAVTSDTPFYVASVAKPFTAACALLAAADGKLELDAPVTKLFPELPKSYAAASVRQLLSHRSGIVDVYDLAIAADLGTAPVKSNAAALALLAKVPRLQFEPGSRMLYSNSGYVLLAEAIARATGSDLAAFARARIFEPLGMKQARFVGEAGLERAAKSWRRGEHGWEEDHVRTGLRGPGGLCLSIDDFVAFERGLVGGKLGDAKLRAAMVEAPAGWHHPRLGRYAAGWMLQQIGGLPVQRHFGGAFSFSADLLRFADEGLTVVVLSNASDCNAATLGPEIARIVLAEEMEEAEAAATAPTATPSSAPVTPKPVALSAAARARFGRIWRDPASGDVWILTPKEEAFVLVSLGDLKLEMVAVSETRLEARDAMLPFAAELEVPSKLVICYADGTRVPLQPVPFPPKDLPPVESCAGDYASESLGATLHFDARDGRLVLAQHDPLLPLAPFVAIAPDLFVCDTGATLVFRRNAEGKPESLVISGNRAWGLEFQRR